MSYNIRIKDNKLIQHGEEVFDKQYFGHFFKKYDIKEVKYYYRFFQGWVRFLDRFLPLKNGQGKKVLEVGCGIGAFAKILHERGFKVQATDISKFIINKASENLSNIDFQVLDIEKKTKVKNRYDYIFAFEVFEHLKHPQTAIENCHKMLKKGGILVFSTPYPSKETLGDPFHINVNLPQFWLSAGQKQGFKDVEVKYASFIPYLYRFHSFFSRAIPFKTNSHFINTTCFYIFRK